MTPVEIMSASAALLNDTAGQIFTSTNQLPYLNIAVKELRETMEQHNIAYFNSTSTTTVTAGVLGIGGAGQPALPANLIEIRELLERTSGTSETYIPMTRVEYLPEGMVQSTYLTWWTWQNQTVKFIGATGNREVYFNFITNTLPDITATTSTTTTALPVINCESFLINRTAALVAQFSGENIERAGDLNTMAQLAMDRFLIINAKGKQVIPYRRRPFRASYRLNTWW